MILLAQLKALTMLLLALYQTAWSATPVSSNSDINIEYLSAIKEKLAEKRKLYMLWQSNRCSFLKNKLN
jgi:thioredoxin-related protein